MASLPPLGLTVNARGLNSGQGTSRSAPRSLYSFSFSPFQPKSKSALSVMARMQFFSGSKAITWTPAPAGSFRSGFDPYSKSLSAANMNVRYGTGLTFLGFSGSGFPSPVGMHTYFPSGLMQISQGPCDSL